MGTYGKAGDSMSRLADIGASPASLPLSPPGDHILSLYVSLACFHRNGHVAHVLSKLADGATQV